MRSTVTGWRWKPSWLTYGPNWTAHQALLDAVQASRTDREASDG